jgi:RNA polymerase sigma-70 factor (ECF subfamily)
LRAEDPGGFVSAAHLKPERGPVAEARPALSATEETDAPDERDLVRRAQHGELPAIEALIGRYQKKVYGIAYQFCGQDRAEAQDMAQEALLHVFKNIKRFEGRSRFSTWLHRVAVNACLDLRRRRRRWTELIFPWRSTPGDNRPPPDPMESIPAPPESGDPLAQVTGNELKRDLASALEALSAQQRIVFQLKVFQDLSVAEIAEITGLAAGTVKSHLFRATHSVRARLRSWVEP